MGGRKENWANVVNETLLLAPHHLHDSRILTEERVQVSSRTSQRTLRVCTTMLRRCACARVCVCVRVRAWLCVLSSNTRDDKLGRQGHCSFVGWCLGFRARWDRINALAIASVHFAVVCTCTDVLCVRQHVLHVFCELRDCKLKQPAAPATSTSSIANIIAYR